MSTNTAEPSGLGGWLILPAIGLCITPFRLAGVLLFTFLPIFLQGYWETLTTPGSEAYHPMWAPLLLTEIAGNVAFIAFGLVLIVLFFTKSHLFPTLYILYLIANVVFVVGDYFLGNMIPAVAADNDPSSIREMARAVGGAVVWIPYFLVSKRVKNTFVKADSYSPVPPMPAGSF